MSLSLQDIDNIESNDVDGDEYYESIQQAINSGSAWSFQGSYGRSMMDAIKSGCCMLGKRGARDYWGNYIPSRDEVQAGTKGSYEFVADAMGVEYADYMASL